MAMRYHIWTEGCQMNEADSAKLAAGLARLGYQEASRIWGTCVT
jgi:tRNA A37 methylthiotransferase MiaB